MAAGDGYKTGRMCKVYMDAAGAGAGTYTRILIAKNPNVGFEWDKAAVEDDASFYKRYLKGLLDAPLELMLNMKTGDTQYEALRTIAMDPEGFVGLAICTNLITVVGTQVFEADWQIYGFPMDMPIGETVTVPLSLGLYANSAFAPTLREVAS